MDEIAKGLKKLSEVVEESQEMLEEIIGVLEENKIKIGQSIQDALKSQNTIGECNKCGNDLVILTSRRSKRFIGCSNYPECRNSYPLPQYGKIVSKGLKCKECDSPEVMVINSKKAPWHICVNMSCSRNKSFNKKAQASA
jgi:DNA topoisomerase-1